jgi:predicted DNA-binding transcriptional regulator AlpA
MNENFDNLVPAPALARELGVARRTLARWIADPAIEFPRPTVINLRLFFSRRAVEAWKAARVNSPERGQV